MRESLKQLKHIFVDNKEYFIRCTLMSVIAALILGLAIGFAVPASAEASTTIIEAGTYKWNDNLTLPFTNTDTVSIPIEFTSTFSPTPEELNLINADLVSQGLPELTYDSYLFSFTYDKIEYSVIQHPDEVMTFSLAYNRISSSVIPDDSYALNIANSVITPNEVYFWDNLGNPPLWGNEYYFQTITISHDTTFIDSSGITFANWFLANTTSVGDSDPEYTISAGWYLWQEELLGEFIPHTLNFNYRTFQRVGDSGIPYYSYWSTMQFDNYVENDSYSSRLYYSSISNGRLLVYDDINGGWVDETYRRFYISSPLTLSAEDYFIFTAYTEYYGDTPPTFPGETVPSVPDPDNNIFTNIIGGVLDALDSFTIIAGFSLLDLITTLLGGMALVWILKLLAGG